MTPNITLSASGDEIIFTNKYVRYVIKQEENILQSYSLIFYDDPSGKNYIEFGPEQAVIYKPFAYFSKSGTKYFSESFNYIPSPATPATSTISGHLEISFKDKNDSSDGEINALKVKCEAHETYFTFEIVDFIKADDSIPGEPVKSIQGDPAKLDIIENFRFAQISLTEDDYPPSSYIDAVIVNREKYIVNEFALNIETNIDLYPNPRQLSVTRILAAEDLFLTKQYSSSPSVFNWIKRNWLPGGEEEEKIKCRGKVALLATPIGNWKSTARQLEEKFVSKTALPFPKIFERTYSEYSPCPMRMDSDGFWAKEHEDLKSSYLFVGISRENATYIINSAKDGGFKYIVARARTWATPGSYDITIPGGEETLKEVANNIHNEGLKFGLHCLTWRIDKKSHFLDSSLDSKLDDLAKGSISLQLKNDIIADNTNDIYATVEPPTTITPAELKNLISTITKQFIGDILIGKEIITIRKVERTSASDVIPIEFKLTGVKRGVHCTDSLDHASSTAIYHLPESLGKYFPDLTANPDFLEEIAEEFGRIFRSVCADFAYFDGVAGQGKFPNEELPTWYKQARVAKAFYDALFSTEIDPNQFNKFITASVTDNNYFWHILARTISSGDYPVIGVEHYMDYQRIKPFLEKNRRNFLYQEIGWIKLAAKPEKSEELEGKIKHIKGFRDFYPSTTPDQIEYQMNRSLGYGVPISLHTDEKLLRANGFTNDILELINNYERVRLENPPPDRILDKLKLNPEDEDFVDRYNLNKLQYHLIFINSGSVALHGLKRRAYAEKVMNIDEIWEFINPFLEQDFKVKLTALPSCANYYDEAEDAELNAPDPTKNKILIDLEDDTNIEAAVPSGVCIRTGKTLTLYSTRGSWCKLTRRTSAIDLSNHKVIALEVTSNKKGAVVSIQLNSSGGNRQYQFKIDFVGRKKIVMPLPTTKELFDYTFGNNPQEETGIPYYLRQSFRPFDYSKITSIDIWIKNIPTGRSTLTFEKIIALRQEHQAIEEPKLILENYLNNIEVEFPTTLEPRHTIRDADPTKNTYYEPWDYLIYNGRSHTQYDGNNIERPKSSTKGTGLFPPGFSDALDSSTILEASGLSRGVVESIAKSIPSTKISSGKNKVKFTHNGSGQNKVLVSILFEDELEYVGETPVLF